MTDPGRVLSHWIEELPHKASMSLLSHVRELSCECAVTEVNIDVLSTFHVEGHGVPAWVALEYIGQTAALIGVYAARVRGASAGSSIDTGPADRAEGFLLASRSMQLGTPWFATGESLVVTARQAGAAGDTLAMFDGVVASLSGTTLATASLSVWRGNPDDPSARVPATGPAS